MNNPIIKAISKGISTNSSFFAFRKPNEEEITFGVQLSHNSSDENCFVIHPFIDSDSCHELKIKNEVSASEFLNLSIEKTPSLHEIKFIETAKDEYIFQVENIIDRINSGNLNKAVLSYTINKSISKSPDEWANKYNKLCLAYPSAYVFMYNSPLSGLWMGASPERFLSINGGTLSTMALAGTRLSTEEDKKWNTKEIEEQEFVKVYIANILSDEKIDFVISPQYTRKAGKIEHICNDFIASNVNTESISKIIGSLHPTPALAGIPKGAAIAAILANEKHNRLYYGGYIGYKQNNENFDYYVNLRSMQFDHSKVVLYVGGGVTKDSVPENEWTELGNKSRTLLSIL